MCDLFFQYFDNNRLRMYIGISRETKLYWKKVKLSREYKLIPVRFCFFSQSQRQKKNIMSMISNEDTTLKTTSLPSTTSRLTRKGVTGSSRVSLPSFINNGLQ